MCLTRITEERIRRKELEKQERREELERQLERQERREELERQERREELERQKRREELERQERRKELERQHQLELRKLELEANSQIQPQNKPWQKTWQKNNVKENVREREFERRRQLRCYECGSYDHLRPQCPKAKTNSETVVSLHVSESRCPDIMTPYTSIGVVNGVGISILRDTGATLDLIPRRFVKPEMYTGESVWIKTPIQEESFCFPLAVVELNCKLGKVVTKAAVLGDSLDQGYYLLGNKTAALLENSFEVPMISAVMTRKQENMNERREVENKDNVQLGVVDSNEHIVTYDQTAKNDDLLTEKIRDSNFTVYFSVYFTVYFPLLFYFPIYR
nr:uncharacterized protein LOC122269263 [Parasteatoda tepidariorum]